jgi:chemotaxis response regulator CheB
MTTPGQEREVGLIRVMVVDDSAVIRGLIKKTLDGDPAVQVVASAHNGAQALRELERNEVDVVVLDIEMPGMDGLEALPKMIALRPGLQVVMASTLTEKNAEISLKALELGAADYIPKPTSNREITSGSDFRSELLMKVKSLAGAARAHAQAQAQPAQAARPAARAFTSENRQKPAVSKFRQQAAPAAAPAAAAKPIATPMFLPSGDITLRKPGTTRPEILAVGSSTGGPQALFQFFADLDKGIPVPIVHHAAHAAHVHDDSGRTHHPRRPDGPDIRGQGRRTVSKPGPYLSGARRLSHDGAVQAARTGTSKLEPGPAGELLPPGGRSDAAQRRGSRLRRQDRHASF